MWSKYWMNQRLCATLIVAMLALPSLASARHHDNDPNGAAPLYPVSPLIVKKGVDAIYPSVAGDFLVFSTHHIEDYGVERVSKYSPLAASRAVKPMVLREAIRFGVALKDGGVGYVSNRSGPISAWMWQGNGESHVAIGQMGAFRGNVAPFHLNATPDGKVWCYDSSLQKVRQNELLNEFGDNPQFQLVGQTWRIYDSDSNRFKMAYKATETGKTNRLAPPVLYVWDRRNSQLTMIPNAFDGTISPDGQHIVFVRETDGNYDLWMQTIDGEELVQLTNSKYGDFEPQFSPDGKHLLFVSNRDYKGTVTRTSIYMMDMQDYHLTRLTNARNASDGGPAWMDAKTVVFHSDRSLKRPQSDTGSHWNIWQLKLAE